MDFSRLDLMRLSGFRAAAEQHLLARLERGEHHAGVPVVGDCRKLPVQFGENLRESVIALADLDPPIRVMPKRKADFVEADEVSLERDDLADVGPFEGRNLPAVAVQEREAAGCCAEFASSSLCRHRHESGAQCRGADRTDRPLEGKRLQLGRRKTSVKFTRDDFLWLEPERAYQSRTAD